jgi:RecB family exonuclease
MKLTVYPTHRAVSNALSNSSSNIVSKVITISDFFEKGMIVEDRVAIDTHSRILLLNESIDFKKIEKLGFEQDFISFIKNSEFIFKFFDEVFAEGIDIDTIASGDIYAEYSDHLDILTHVYQSYKQNLQEHGYYDRATIDKYSINSSFFENFSSIDIYIEGILTSVEFDILIQVSQILPLNVYIEYNRFNKKMVSKFESYGIDLDKYGSYILDISNKKCKEYEKRVYDTKFEVEAFSNSLLQSAYIFKKIYDFVEIENIDPSKIVVILPDEKYASTLEKFDTKNNLNFAMGKPFSNSRFFHALQAIYLYFSEYNKENIQRVQKESLSEIVDEIKNSIGEKNAIDKLYDLIEKLKDRCSDKEIELIESTKYSIEKFAIKLKRYSFRELISFAIRLFNDLNIDDIGSGKIKVIGVLESRSIEFEAAIIASFNEGVVPRVSSKDIFLNSKIKSLVNLPTKKDREELQKYYYTRVFNNSKHISICYVQNDENRASRFLKELGLSESSIKDTLYQNIIFNTPNIVKHYNQDLVVENSWLNDELSATKFAVYLACKRKFYYQYIKSLKAPSDENRDKLTLGNLFHNAFAKVIDSSYSDPIKLKQAITTEVLENLKDINIKFDLYKWLRYIDKFCEVEVHRYNSGVSVLEKEQTHKINHNGINLMGRVDRVDIKDDKLSIIDYKIKENIKLDTIKTYEKSSDFQLEFYYLFMKKRYQKEIEGVYVYDIKHSKLVPEEMIHEKLAMLDEKLDEYKAPTIELSKCEDRSVCRFCPYKTICERD